ncbi:hypothetical protein E1B28_009265 [Marasmius oreades]|uniref:Uncharacterized protein n=1 Tax=Marasmius oreades TaxID=181124 RepID=A0A9P7S018_9AGAR|nr:uncharacterized protein E1B28_009265 [Marasmius oreades]KAG7092964.1 hypothetical protein E1B28_009265 [Marasmius oreades]
MSSRVQPANLKERIAAIEQRNNASQRQRPLSPPPTTSTGSSFLTPQTTGSGGGGALKEKIARFEKKGGVPVPRGSFGLGAPPPVEKGPIKRRGELYGNRIPSAARSHTTGPQLSSGGISTHLTGPSPPSRSEARHSHSFALDGNGKIPGLEYDENSEDTGGFEPPDSSLGQPQQFLSYTSASRTSSPVPPVPSLSDPPRPERVAKAERRVASDSVRRGIAFATALELARKVESDQQVVYDPRSRETSLSPNLTGSSRQNSPPIGVDDVSQNVQQTAPSIVVSTGEAEEVGPDLILEDDKVTGYDDDREHIQAQIQQEEPTLPLPISSSEVESEHPETESLETSQSSNLQSQPVSISSIAPDAGDSSSITFDAPVNEPVTNPKVVDEVLPNSAVDHINASVDVEPPALPPAVPVPAESETKSSDELSQEIALSETHVTVLTSLEQLPVETAGATNISEDESDSGASSESTIQDTRVLKEVDEDDDSDLFVRPIKRRSPMNNSFEERSSLAQSSGDSLDNDVSPVASSKDPLPDPTRLAPSTPSKAATGSMIDSEDSQTSSELPTARDSYISQTSQTSQTVTIASRPASMMDSSSPGHVLFAQRISPATSRGVPIFIPASSERQTTDSSTPSTVEPLYIQKRSDNDIPEEDTGISEFGTVTVGGGSSTLRPSHSRGYTEPEYEKINNRVSTFSAVVHRKVRETQTLPASSKKAPSTPSKRKPASVAEPMSPGFNELSMLMQQSVLLESRLLIGDYPDESGAKREVVGRGANEKGREREREHPEEAMKLKRTNSGKSGKSHDSEGKKRKLSLKRTFGIGKNARREGVPPMESIPASPPPPGASVKDISRSKSMDTLRSSQSATVPPLPSFSLEPPPLPKPGKARSIHALSTEPKHTDSSASASSATGPGKYLSSIRRFASSSRSHAAQISLAQGLCLRPGPEHDLDLDQGRRY